MEKKSFENAVCDFLKEDSGNFVAENIALRPELAKMQMFDAPLFGYAAAADPLFAQFKTPGIIGEHFVLPGEWLNGAQTVISAFLPFTEAVKKANGANMDWPADEWLHARIEGQAFMAKLIHHAAEHLEKEGFAALVPLTDKRFSSKHPHVHDATSQDFYTSNWSERHVAYVCGLGTFGLSKGLITKKGVAGRFMSLVTTAFFEPSERPYASIDAYCTRCGACIRNCPAKAISLEKGKEHPVCSTFIDRTMEQCKPRYGCGKCQVKVPCESNIP